MVCVRIHKIKITYIITLVKIPSFCVCNSTVFMSFMNTNIVSGYLTTPVVKEALYNHHLSSRLLTTIQRHKLQHKLHITHTAHLYAQNYSQNILLTNGIPAYVQSYKHLLPLSWNSWIQSSYTFSLTHLTPCVKISLFVAHASVNTMRIFMFPLPKGLKQKSTWTLTHVCDIGFLSIIAFSTPAKIHIITSRIPPP